MRFWSWLATSALLGVPSVRAANESVQKISVAVDGATDIPRVLELIGLREGDSYSEPAAERGLLRLADTGKFLGVSSNYDSNSGELRIQLTLVPRVAAVEVHLNSEDNDDVASDLDTDVNEVVGLSVGDAILPEQITGIRERVLNRLHDRGYRSAQVVISLEQVPQSAQVRVLISASLSKRTILHEIRLRGFTQQDITEFYGLMNLSRRGLPKASTNEDVVVFLQKPLDTIEINEAMNEWNQQVREKGYFDFQLKSTETTENLESKMLFELTRGPKYDIKFHGNVAFWGRTLREKVIDRPKRLGVPLNLQETESLLTREYEKEGYSDVTVHSHIEDKLDRRRVHFEITEGKKYFQGPIHFAGITEAERQELEPQIIEWLRAYRDPTKRMPYDEKFLRSELPKILIRVRSQGYLDARILELRSFEDARLPLMHVDIPLQLGERYFVRTININGNLSLSGNDLAETIDLKTGDPVDPIKIVDIRRQLQNRYRELGFLSARVTEDESQLLKRVPETQQVDINFDVNQGPQIRVGSVVVEGLVRTKEQVVLRELRKETLAPGTLWTPSGTDRLEQQLLNLSIFGGLTFEPIGGHIVQRASSDGSQVEVQEKDLKISLNERPSGSIEFGPGFRDDRGLIGFAELNYRNLGGWNRSAQVRTQVSRKLDHERFVEQNYSFTYLEPFALDQRIRMRFNTQYDKADLTATRSDGGLSGYSKEEVSFTLSAEAEIARNLRLIPKLYSLAFRRTFDIDTPEKNRIATVGAALLYDNRDNVFNPTRGWMLSGSFDYSAPQIGSRSFDAINQELNFAKYRQEASTYLSIGGGNVVAFSAAYTHLWAFGNKGIPVASRPTLGGGSSIRAIGEGKLFFEQPGLGAHNVYEARVEYRVPLFNDIGLAYFIDMGEIDASGNDLTTGAPIELSTRMRTGLGVGLRYKTPVGPIAVDAAYNTNPLYQNGVRQEDLIHFSLNIGAF
ncbi:MAG: BamA/TamA family outer membrane protein [Bdellovibrionales bacterium]|nr:BamA/TamA family outer membrane protein [Bdellovibrionales bacterium]